MRILLVGEWRFAAYEEALAVGLAHHGAEVIPFRISEWLRGGLLSRIQAKLINGPAIWRMNRTLVEIASRHRPDLIFFQLPIFVFPETMAALRQKLPRSIIAAHNHDNPFEHARRFYWRHYIGCLKSTRLNFFARPSTVQLASSLGVPRPRLLRQYYLEGVHRPLASAGTQQSGIVFIGHYEPDGREEYCNALLAQGLPLRIFGPRWQELPSRSPLRQMQSGSIYGNNYVRAICAAKVCLVFLSGMNQDPYTTRCFEIPACGGFMLAPRTAELQAIYKEGREAEYFSSPAELCEKAVWYLDHGDERQRIANAGYLRCLRDRHSNVDRAGEILREVHEFRAQQEGTRE